jgi:hypothetical protein
MMRQLSVGRECSATMSSPLRKLCTRIGNPRSSARSSWLSVSRCSRERMSRSIAAGAEWTVSTSMVMQRQRAPAWQGFPPASD